MGLTKTHLEEFVDALYLNMDIYHPEELDIEIISSRMGFLVEYIAGPSKGMQIGSSTVIMLNDSLKPALQWQDFAHEVAHLLRHSGNQYILPSEFRVLQEWQASHFALYFCVPGFMLQNIDLPYHKQEAILKVMDVFHVTPAFAAARLEKWFTHIFF